MPHIRLIANDATEFYKHTHHTARKDPDHSQIRRLIPEW